jgi:RimJ/RimL family protein N-acetyltransferase
VNVPLRELSTDRLLLRQWREADREPFADLNADPEVMRYFTSTMTREESDAFAHDIAAEIDHQGWGLWAVEVVGGPGFIGFAGLNEPRFEAHFTPAVEVGWRLARDHWGHGYATEAARAAVGFGFAKLGLDEVVSMIVPANTRSRHVAERLGMTRDPADDFDHPRVTEGPLRRHMLYRLARRAD